MAIAIHDAAKIGLPDGKACFLSVADVDSLLSFTGFHSSALQVVDVLPSGIRVGHHRLDTCFFVILQHAIKLHFCHIAIPTVRTHVTQKAE